MPIGLLIICGYFRVLFLITFVQEEGLKSQQNNKDALQGMRLVFLLIGNRTFALIT